MKTKLKILLCLFLFLTFFSKIDAQVVYTVTNNLNSGAGSFRQAMLNAAATTNLNVSIYFNLPSGSTTISLLSEVIMSSTSTATKNVYIYGQTNPTGQVILQGTGTAGINGLTNNSYYINIHVQGLQFQNFNRAVSNLGYYSTIGTTAAPNIFINNNRGLYYTGYGSIIGNYLGTNKSFSTGMGNYVGFEIYGGSVTVSNNYICSNTYAIYSYNSYRCYYRNNIIGTNNTSATRTDLGNSYVFYGTISGNSGSYPYFWGNTIAYTLSYCFVVNKYLEIERNDFICNAGTFIYNVTPYTTPSVSSITSDHYGYITISGTSAAVGDSIVIFSRDPSVCGTTYCQGKWLTTVASNTSRQWSAYVKVNPGQQVLALANGFEREVIIGGANPSDSSFFMPPNGYFGMASQPTGCYTVQCPTGVTFTFAKTRDVYCYGGNDGAAQLTLSSPFYISFSYAIVNTITGATVASGTTMNPGSPTVTISSLPAGTYQAVLTNPNNKCTYLSSIITIGQPTAALAIKACGELSPPTTLTSNDGIGQVTVSNGTSPYAITVRNSLGAVVYSGSSTNGTFNITGLAPGTYSVTVTDTYYANAISKTGCITTCSFTISTPTCTNLITQVTQQTPPQCYNGTGIVGIRCQDISANLPITVTFNNTTIKTIYSSTDSTVTFSAQAGSYSILVRDRVGCTKSLSATITQPTQLSMTCPDSTRITHAKRVGEASGSAILNIFGGTAPYTLILTGTTSRTITTSLSTYTISNLAAGTYTVRLLDNNNCTGGSCTFAIKNPDCTGFSAAVSRQNVSCFNGTNGSISLDPNGQDPYTYQWSANANVTGNQEYANNLKSGVYLFTVTDDKGCQFSSSAVITAPSTALTTNISSSNATSVGTATGSISVTPAGGTPNYNVNLTLNGTSMALTNRQGNTFSFNFLGRGVYISTATDTNGCAKFDTIRINDPSCGFTLTSKVDSVRCFKGSDGKITITPTGQTTSLTFTYFWNITGIGNTPSVSNLKEGIYSVTVTTNNGCRDSLDLEVYQPDSLAVSGFGIDVTTVGGTNGKIDITVNGGTPSYTVTMPSRPVTQNSINSFSYHNLPKGTYTFTVTDAKGCSQSKTVTINDPVCNITLDRQIDSIECNNGRGGVNIVANNTVGTLTYNWNPSSIGNVGNPTNLAAGSYSVTVIDSRLCQQSLSITLSQPSPLTATITIKDVSLYNGTNGKVSVIVRGGVKPYSVVLDSLNATVLSDSSFEFNNLRPGSYTFNVTDANRCVFTQTIIVKNQPCIMTVSQTIKNISCKGGRDGEITLTQSNGRLPILYTWSNNISTTNKATNLTAGIYSVTVADSVGCTVAQQMTISEPDALVVIPTKTDILSVGDRSGEVKLNVSGGTPNYNVSLTLNGTAISASQTGPPQYIYSNLGTGTYLFTVIDANGCTQSGTLTINEPICDIRITKEQTNVLCNGESNGRAFLTAFNGRSPYTFIWNDSRIPNTANPTNLAAGKYTFTVVDAQNCRKTDSIIITQPAKLTSSVQIDPITTNGGSNGKIRLTVTGGTQPYTVTMKKGVTNISPTTNTNTLFSYEELSKGSYSYTIRDANGCIDSATIQLNDPSCNSLLVTTTQTNVSCKGGRNGSISVSQTGGTGPFTYIWSNRATTTTINNLAAGNYSVTVNDVVGCVQTANVTITEPDSLIVRLISQRNIMQVGGASGQITVEVSGGTAPYRVTSGALTATTTNGTTYLFDNLRKGTYTITVVDSKNCSTTITVILTEPSCTNVSAKITVNTTISCFGQKTGQITATVTSIQTPQYSWNPNLGTTASLSNLGAGTYKVTATDATTGCFGIDSIVLTQPLENVASIKFRDTAICKGQAVRLLFSVTNASRNITLVLRDNFGNIQSILDTVFTVQPTVTTVYRLESLRVGTCQGRVLNDSVIVRVSNPSVPTGFKVEKDSICAGLDIRLSVNTATNATQYIWLTPQGNRTTTVPQLTIENATVANTGNYSVRIAENNCTSDSVASKIVRVFSVPTEKPDAGRDTIACSQSSIVLNAKKIVNQGITGRWLALSGGTIANPNSNVTTVANANVGVNRFIWVLSAAVCGEIGRDTVAISVSTKPELGTTPPINLDSKLTSLLINTQELLKDHSIDPSVFSVKILKSPDKAIVEVRNNTIYFDRNNLLDAQTIEIEYEICSKICTNLCSTGKLIIVLQQYRDDSDFTVPKVFAINNRNGSSLEINGLDFYLDNEITIVDRWGGTVFGPTPYKSNIPEKSWDGTKNGKTLPTGAYYYFIRYKDNNILKMKKGIIYLVEER
ncbi:MAG: gliding motility-associated C-terminal domain-containing protein [Saprospiraceae bacterium]|nr:gliding motility-associated C-terminal domain-containing protein [Saprospiraceae bacterium]